MKANQHTIEGILLQVSEKILKGKNNDFEVRYVLLETDESEYSQKIKLECLGKKADVVSPDWEGKSVSLDFNLKGFEYNDKNYVNLAVYDAKLLEEEVEEVMIKQQSSFGTNKKENNIPF